MEITLTIPDYIVPDLQNGSSTPLPLRLLEMAALEDYKSGEFTLPQVQAMLGFESRFELDGSLKANDVMLDSSPEEIAGELATIKILQAAR